MPRPLYVTQPILPELGQLHSVLEEIWKSKILTNGGPFHARLEEELMKHMNVPTAMLFNNGTVALLVALKLFDLPIGSEVITTPLTFAATAHAISWNGLQPVFVDICPDTLTIDPAAVQKAITSKTSAILGVHVYGTICAVDQLAEIASNNNLKLIYDAAHAFSTTVNGKSIANFGDASVFSFHATKLFNTLEGGLIATNRPEDRSQIYFLRNFGIKSEEEVVSIGINGKMNEIQAAIGLLNLPLVEPEKKLRAKLRGKYNDFLSDLPGIKLQPDQPNVSRSEQYFPLVIDPAKFGRTRDDIYLQLKTVGIFSRKYFHPVCTDFEPYKHLPIHSTKDHPYIDQVKRQVLCLPFHGEVSDEDINCIRSVFLEHTI